MPIRPELRKFYTKAAGWPAVRRRTLERAGGTFNNDGKYLQDAKCENCGKPDRQIVGTSTTTLFGQIFMWWIVDTGTREWRNQYGEKAEPGGRCITPYHVIRVVLTCAHLDQNPANNAPKNVRALCQWCHLNFDAVFRAMHARVTRCTKKDSRRPLLQETA